MSIFSAGGGFTPYSMFGRNNDDEVQNKSSEADDDQTKNNASSGENDPDNVDVNSLFAEDDSGSDNETAGSKNTNPNNDDNNFDDRWNSHLESLQFANGVEFTDEETNAIQNGDMRPVLAAVNKIGRQVYNRALRDTNAAVQSQIQSAIQQAVQQATGNVNADMAVASMERELPYLENNPWMREHATGLLNKALKKGKPLSEAIVAVDAAFKKFSNSVGGGNTNYERPGNSRPTDVKMTQPRNNSKQRDEWDDILAAN